MCIEEKLTIETEEKRNILSETSRVVWKEVEFFYAKGIMIYVSDELDLIQVAHTLAIDDAEQIEEWVNAKKILRSFDQQAKTWSEGGEEIWSVVVKPWVLVQPIKKS